MVRPYAVAKTSIRCRRSGTSVNRRAGPAWSQSMKAIGDPSLHTAFHGPMSLWQMTCPAPGAPAPAAHGASAGGAKPATASW